MSTDRVQGITWMKREGPCLFQWHGRSGTATWYVSWDEVLKNDWSALHSCDGRPFARITGPALVDVVEDLQAWLRSTGGEIPRAPGAPAEARR